MLYLNVDVLAERADVVGNFGSYHLKLISIASITRCFFHHNVKQFLVETSKLPKNTKRSFRRIKNISNMWRRKTYISSCVDYKTVMLLTNVGQDQAHSIFFDRSRKSALPWVRVAARLFYYFYLWYIYSAGLGILT